MNHLKDIMATKSGFSKLDNDNSDQEDKPEEQGTFKKASENELQQRVVLKPKRSNAGTEERKNPFAGFDGFGENIESAISAFGSHLTPSVGKKDSASSVFGSCFTPSVQNKGSVPSAFGHSFTSSAEKEDSAQKKREPGSMVFGIRFTTADEKKDYAPSGFGHCLASSVENKVLDQSVFGRKSDSSSGFSHWFLSSDENKNVNKDYLSHLKALNSQVVAWIQKLVEKNPLVFLTPVFKDYEKHLKSIAENQTQSSSFRATAGQSTTFFGESVKQKVPSLRTTASQPSSSFGSISSQHEPSIVGSFRSTIPTVTPVATGGFSFTAPGPIVDPEHQDVLATPIIKENSERTITDEVNIAHNRYYDPTEIEEDGNLIIINKDADRLILEDSKREQNYDAGKIVSELNKDLEMVKTLLVGMFNIPPDGEIYAYLEAHVREANRVQIIVDELSGINNTSPTHSRKTSPVKQVDGNDPKGKGGQGKKSEKSVPTRVRPVILPVTVDKGLHSLEIIEVQRKIVKSNNMEDSTILHNPGNSTTACISNNIADPFIQPMQSVEVDPNVAEEMETPNWREIYSEQQIKQVPVASTCTTLGLSSTSSGSALNSTPGPSGSTLKPTPGPSGSKAQVHPRDPEEVDPEIKWQREKEDYLIDMFPDFSPAWLSKEVKLFVMTAGTDDARFNIKVSQIMEMEKHEIPSRKEWERKIKEQEELDKWSGNMTVQDMLELYEGNPAQHFNNPSRKNLTSEKELLYRQHSRTGLMDKYRFASNNIINRELKKVNYNYSMAFKAMAKIPDSRKKKRTNYEAKYPTDVCIEFLKEKKFVELEDAIAEEKTKRETDSRTAFEVARANNVLVDCECCCEECLDEDMIPCKGGHLYCKECINNSTNVALGDGKTRILCLGQCQEEIITRELQKALPPNILSKLLSKRQAEEVGAADIENLVTCPYCPYSTIMENQQDKVVVCRNPECGRNSCRLCKQRNHVPLRCEEVETQEQIRKRVEEALSDAVIRKCANPKCTASFMKTEGCNRMCCPTCRTIQCYVCKTVVPGYEHFYGLRGEPNNAQVCPLWSNSKKIHEAEISRAAQREAAALEHEGIQLLNNPLEGIELPAMKENSGLRK